MHCDTLGIGLRYGASFRRHGGAIDLERGREYHPWVQAMAAFVHDRFSGEEAWRHAMDLFNTASRWAAEEPEECHLLRRDESFDSVLQTGCTAMLTVENGGTFGELTPAMVEELVTRGVRMVGITWNGDNALGSGCFGDASGGLTSIGKAAVAALEEQHMVPDVSHLNETGFWELARIAKRPFVASHSDSAAVYAHPRNLTDEQFRAIRDSGGVVGINLFGEHLGEQSFAAFERHLAHFLELDGESTVCLGTDLDGFALPPEWGGIRAVEALQRYLLDKGYSAEMCYRLFYGNACAFFSRVDM